MRYQTEEVLEIVKAIRDDAAGNKQATMTEMDLAGNMLESLAKQRDQLRDKIETLRKDAARYRWLRDRGDACQWMDIIRIDIEEFVMQDNALDAAIDEAMTEKEVKDE